MLVFHLLYEDVYKHVRRIMEVKGTNVFNSKVKKKKPESQKGFLSCSEPFKLSGHGETEKGGLFQPY